MERNEGDETESRITTPLGGGPFRHETFGGGLALGVTPLGSSRTATPQGGHVYVMVTTISMVDNPTFDAIDTLRNRVISAASQGTVVP